jgi:hypothetical protein
LRAFGDRPIRRVGAHRETEELPPNALTVEEAERAVAFEPVEWLYIFAPDGRQIARFRGTRETVSISDELARRTSSHGLYGDPVLKDCVVVHNHPQNLGEEAFPLSPTDLFFAVTHDLSRFIVVTGGDRFELRRPGRIWPLDDSDVMPLFREIVDTDAQNEGPTGEMHPSLVRRNVRAFERMHERGLIGFGRHRSPRHD